MEYTRFASLECEVDFQEILRFVVEYRAEHGINPHSFRHKMNPGKESHPAFDDETATGTFVYGVLIPTAEFDDHGFVSGRWRELLDQDRRKEIVEYIRGQRARKNRAEETVEA